MESFSYQVINGWIVLEIGGCRALLNTASPDSMGSEKSLTIDHREYPLKERALRTTPEELSFILGTRIDVMLGGDILNYFDYKILPEGNRVVVSADELKPSGYSTHFSLFKGIPLVNISVKGKEIPVFFNTASRISYLLPPFTSGCDPCGTRREYYPGIGVFETECRQSLIWVAGSDVELETGLPTPALAGSLTAAGAFGVLGLNVFKRFEVCLAPRRREIYWWRRGINRVPEDEVIPFDPNALPGFYY